MAAYGDGINPKEVSRNAAHIIAGTIYSGIIFDIDSGKVESIYMGAAGE